MKFEAIDPFNPSHVCVVTVIKVLKFNYFVLGVDSLATYFVCHANSINVFPCGWAKAHDLQLHPPRGSVWTNERALERTNERTTERKEGRTDERTNERKIERMNEPTNKREKDEQATTILSSPYCPGGAWGRKRDNNALYLFLLCRSLPDLYETVLHVD